MNPLVEVPRPSRPADWIGKVVVVAQSGRLTCFRVGLVSVDHATREVLVHADCIAAGRTLAAAVDAVIEVYA